MDKRPWLTLAIDVFTRMVVGFHLSIDEPSRVSLGLCMLNAVYDKSAWLKERSRDASWPAWPDLPETSCIADNAAPISASQRFLGRACREEGIQLIFRPKGAPHFGGHIERLIGTTMGRVHFFPGSSCRRSRRAPGQRSRTLRRHDVPRESRMRASAGRIAGALQPAGSTAHAVAAARSAMARAQLLQRGALAPSDRMTFWVLVSTRCSSNS